MKLKLLAVRTKDNPAFLYIFYLKLPDKLISGDVICFLRLCVFNNRLRVLPVNYTDKVYIFYRFISPPFRSR